MFEVADGFFHRAVVGRIVRRTIERQHLVLGEDGVDIVAFER